MMKKLKRALITAIAVLALSSPAFARSGDPYFGAGKKLAFNYRENGAENRGMSVHRQPLFNSISPHSRRLYDLAPSDPNSPGATGGGSLGYNQMLLIY